MTGASHQERHAHTTLTNGCRTLLQRPSIHATMACNQSRRQHCAVSRTTRARTQLGWRQRWAPRQRGGRGHERVGRGPQSTMPLRPTRHSGIVCHSRSCEPRVVGSASEEEEAVVRDNGDYRRRRSETTKRSSSSQLRHPPAQLWNKAGSYGGAGASRAWVRGLEQASCCFAGRGRRTRRAMHKRLDRTYARHTGLPRAAWMPRHPRCSLSNNSGKGKTKRRSPKYSTAARAGSKADNLQMRDALGRYASHHLSSWPAHRPTVSLHAAAGDCAWNGRRHTR